MNDKTVSFIDHYSSTRHLQILIGTINGQPIYGPFEVRNGGWTVTVSSEWLKANPPKTYDKP